MRHLTAPNLSELPAVRISKGGGGVSALTNTSPPAILIPTHHPSNSSFQQSVTRRKGHGPSHPTALNAFSRESADSSRQRGGRTNLVWDKLQLTVTPPFLNQGLVCFGAFVAAAEYPAAVCLTCPIRRSSVCRPRPAASPGESAG